MSSPYHQPTRVQPPAPQPAPPAAAAGALDLKTLIITAVASALAAFICSKVWAPGTLASAAFTPVAVAVFREALRKPTEVVTTALPAALPIARRTASDPGPYGAPTGPGTPFSDADPTRVHDVVPGPDEQPTRVSPAIGPQGPGAVGAEPVTVHAVAARNRRRWQVAIVTGLLGFVIAALLITVPEVLAGKDSTTIFREGRSTPAKTQATPATTTTTETVTPTVTTVAPETVTRTETVPTTTTPTETTTVTEEAPATTTTTRSTPTTPTTPEDGAVDPADQVP
ncbi:hypothetical protein [Patulibacter sp.]|uniref:hypothetical protein n=1 Tax=Patulibacter sp. TaxID=1912859 RepID=UPI00271E6D2A|nr:hypothetical protein [Patulibacter sp.]MDO9410620.1 hypothetical protein [Patulibacter sp.]